MPRGVTHALGIDIGSDAIKAVELQLTGAGIQLVGTPACVPTPAGSISGGVVVEGSQVSAALADMVAAYNFRVRQVIASVGGDTSVVVRIASMPRMEKKELEDAMQWELDRQTPFPVDQVIYDYQVIEAGEAAEGESMDVFLAVAQEDMVNAHVEALTGAKLTPVHIDVEPLAISRALVHATSNGYKDQTVALVHIGATTTGISIENKGWLHFVRSLPTAGNALTAAIRENITGDEQHAERAKRQFAELTEATGEAGEAPAGGAEGADDVAQARQAVQEAIAEPLYDLATEIGRSIDFYQRQHREEHISTILLSGGRAVIPGLAEFVHSETGVPTQVANPYQDIICDPDQVAESYLAQVGPATVVALGLAMWDMVED